MKRFRWALFLLAGRVLIGAGASAVLARSNATTATYWNNAIAASTSSSAGSWLGYGQTATWKFGDVTGLQDAMTGTVYLNFTGLSKSTLTGGGSGYSTTMKVVVTGAGTTTFTQTLNNPWRPHVAYSASPGAGWQAYASLNLPAYIWTGASSLTVKVTSLSSNTYMSIEHGGLLIGYTTMAP
jgi:hypothetical protein